MSVRTFLQVHNALYTQQSPDLLGLYDSTKLKKLCQIKYFLLKYQNIMELFPNSGKNLIIEIESKKYARYPVKTHLITSKDNIVDVVEKYIKEHLKRDDVIFIGEKIVAISQDRAYQKDKIKPGRLARFLVRFVTKSPYGIGLGSPETMQLAVEEVGTLRIIFAALIAAITKPFGLKGFFYRIAGAQARGIDGPVSYTIPPYNTYAIKTPKNRGISGSVDGLLFCSILWLLVLVHHHPQKSLDMSIE